MGDHQGIQVVRILLIADTHLGFDLPLRPRIERRRRGRDFFDNFEKALQPAYRGEVDLVIHGGDLFFRSKIPSSLVEIAVAPLKRIAEKGIKVYLVPGNHERSQIPRHLWAMHPNIHIFDRPRTYIYFTKSNSLALAGFPYCRNIRDNFHELLNLTCYRLVNADAQLLCIHQIVEGAQVGVTNYTFRYGSEVINGQDIPEDFSAVVCGHVHRAQLLTYDLKRKPMPTPVIYPGSVERTSFAERDEIKKYVRLDLDLGNGNTGALSKVEFMPLPTRPMVNIVLNSHQSTKSQVIRNLQKKIAAIDSHAVVRLQIKGPNKDTIRRMLSAAILRELAPTTMNVTLSYF